MTTRNLEVVPEEDIPLQNRDVLPQASQPSATDSIVKGNQESVRHKKITKYLTIAMMIISLVLIVMGTFAKKDDTESTKKIETVTVVLYKIMNALSNNPQLLAITEVDANEQITHGFAHFDFHPPRRNVSASGKDLH